MRYQEEIIEAYKGGLKVTEIARMYDMTCEAVYLRLRKLEDWNELKAIHESALKVVPSVALAELLMSSDNIVEGWLAGVTMSDLANEFEVGVNLISKVINKVYGSTRKNYKRDLKIADEYKAGVRQIDLADKYGISQPIVSRIVNALAD